MKHPWSQSQQPFLWVLFLFCSNSHLGVELGDGGKWVVIQEILLELWVENLPHV